MDLDMDRYRSYMDRLKLSAADHQRILDALGQPKPRRSLLPRLAACLLVALVGAGCFLLWRSHNAGQALAPGVPSATPAVSGDRFALSPTSAPTDAPTAGQTAGFLVPDLPDGYYFTDEFLSLPDLTGGESLYICSGYPTADTQISSLSEGELCAALGADDLTGLSLLGWSGFTVSGAWASIPEQGVIWAKISGVCGESSFRLSLAPDALPPMDENYEDALSFEKNGVSVSGYLLRDDRDGDGVLDCRYRVSFLHNGTGVYFEAVSPDETVCQLLTKALLARGTAEDGGFSLDGLGQETPHTLVVQDPFDGQPHSSFMLPALSFPQWEDGAIQTPGSASLYLPGHTRALTERDILIALGNPDEVPWMLNWVGFGVDGTALYDEEDRFLSARITGVNGETSFTLALTPASPLPEEGGWQETQYGGVSLATWRKGDVYSIVFPCGEGYARFSCTGPNADFCADLCTRAASVGAGSDGGFTLFFLKA